MFVVSIYKTIFYIFCLFVETTFSMVIFNRDIYINFLLFIPVPLFSCRKGCNFVGWQVVNFFVESVNDRYNLVNVMMIIRFGRENLD